MGIPEQLPHSQRWARIRFAIVGRLLAQSSETAGSLRSRIAELAALTWEHPITGVPVQFSFSTMQRWYYAAVASREPTAALMRVVRKDAGHSRSLTPEVLAILRQSHADHRSWSYLLHYDNLAARLTGTRTLPSYVSVWRFMRRTGLQPSRHPADRHQTPAAQATRLRFASREVRSFEHTHTHALWHIDAHHAGMSLSHQGISRRPVMIALIDDHSRLILHGQWFWYENTRSAAHVIMQAIVRHGLPRAILSDNGGPFVAAEIAHGLHRLGILHETTLCYAPNQNGKMEIFWAQVEGRFIAMLRGQRDVDLYRLNELSQAWVTQEYHQRRHASLDTTPLHRYEQSPHTGREAPASLVLAQAFTRRETRRQRRSDGTISLSGRRFQIPSHYRHHITLTVRYASWDLDRVFLAHPQTDAILERLLPVDRAAQASGFRAELSPIDAGAAVEASEPVLPPLLQRALDTSRSTGLPSGFIPLIEDQPSEQPSIAYPTSTSSPYRNSHDHR